MDITFGERVARCEQVISDLRADVSEIRTDFRADHHRLREAETAIRLLVESQREEQRAADVRQRRIELRLQALTVVVAVAAIVAPLLLAVTR